MYDISGKVTFCRFCIVHMKSLVRGVFVRITLEWSGIFL